MQFDLNEDQRALADSLGRLLTDQYSFEKRRALAASSAGWSEATWRAVAELGLTALPVPEAQGGLGGQADDLLPVMQAFGRALYIEPYLGSVVLPVSALVAAGTPAARAEHLAAIAGGQTIYAWACDEAAGRHAPMFIETQARQTAQGWRLTGTKARVLHAAAAQRLLVSARTAGAADDAQGITLFVVDTTAAGLGRRDYRLIDDTIASDLTLADVPALPVTEPGDRQAGTRALAAARDYGIAAVCADMVGCMEAAMKLGADYLKTRKQFGRLLGENQSLRHRAADMLVSLELSRSMAVAAFAALANPDAPDSKLDLMRAKMLIGRHARSVCHSAIQVHGGIGMTEEYAVGHYLRRVHVLDQWFGDTTAQATRLAELV